MQETINQRLKFLIDALGLSVRAFSSKIDAPASTTRNYLDKETKPSSDYIERITTQFSDVNLNWLIAGKGQPFLSDTQSSATQTGSFNVTGSGNKQSIKGNVQANSGGKNTQNNFSLDDCKHALQESQREVEYLQGQVRLQQEVIAAKEETITLLRASFNRPN